MARTNQGNLLLCGTNSFKPVCREYGILPGNYTMEKEKPGQAVCPYDPHHNSTAIYVGEYNHLNTQVRNFQLSPLNSNPTQKKE